MKKHLLLLSCLSIFSLSGPANSKGFEVDVGYWRMSLNSETTFREEVNEGDKGPGVLDIKTGNIVTSRNAVKIETDPSKFVFDARYRFVDSLQRLTLGVQYAGAGNNEVKKVAIINQPFDLVRVLEDFSAKRLTYVNYYASYRLFPLESDDFEWKGLDLWLTFDQIDQEYSLAKQKSGFTTTSNSLGVGVGAENILGNRFHLKGRAIYLPFYDLKGDGWDSEAKISYDFTDWLSIYFGGKWLSVNVELAHAIGFIAPEGFVDNGSLTLRTMDTELSGYTLGATIKF